MAYIINENCSACGKCMPECAFEAIIEEDGKFVIDADLCEECEACLEVCESSAIEKA